MRRGLQFGIVTVAVAAFWMLAWPRPAIRQPMLFDHVKHKQVGCALCHQGSESGVRAGLPEGDVCLQCHATAPSVEGAAAAWKGLAEGRRISWVRLAQVPDHVLFSHRRHVTLGQLDCVSCHGDVGSRSTPPPRHATRVDMAACESCHREQRASNDCAGCHR
jgi:hypothetical protein